LEVVLLRCVKQSELLLKQVDRPLGALGDYIQRLLDSDFGLKEFVRNVDVEWGRTMGERPLFEKDGAAPDANDPYTIESVRKSLVELLKKLPAQA
jgi:hypothetical protein